MIDLNFNITTDLLCLSLKEHEGKGFLASTKEGQCIILCPKDTDFTSRQMQMWLKKVIEEMLRKQAKILFPTRLKNHAERFGFTYNRLTIKSSRTRWGSCSSLGNINLSLYLMQLPSHLIDYVMLHELCHTREMNHGKDFWRLLNQCTDGKAHQLRDEMRQFRTLID